MPCCRSSLFSHYLSSHVVIVLHMLLSDLTLVVSLTEYVSKYASKEAVDEAGEDTESEDELSSAGSYESGGEEPAGAMDDV